MPRSEQGKINQKEYIKKYKEEHYKLLTVKLKKKDDAYVLDYLNSHKGDGGVSSLIRKILIEHIEKNS